METVKRVIVLAALALIVVIGFNACSGTGTVATRLPATRYSASQFSQIRNGMSMQEVASITGNNGEVVSDYGSQNFHEVTRSWANEDGSNMVVSFTNGEVTGKSQLGLR